MDFCELSPFSKKWDDSTINTCITSVQKFTFKRKFFAIVVLKFVRDEKERKAFIVFDHNSRNLPLRSALLDRISSFQH